MRNSTQSIPSRSNRIGNHALFGFKNAKTTNTNIHSNTSSFNDSVSISLKYTGSNFQSECQQCYTPTNQCPSQQRQNRWKQWKAQQQISYEFEQEKKDNLSQNRSIIKNDNQNKTELEYQRNRKSISVNINRRKEEKGDNKGRNKSINNNENEWDQSTNNAFEIGQSFDAIIPITSYEYGEPHMFPIITDPQEPIKLFE